MSWKNFIDSFIVQKAYCAFLSYVMMVQKGENDHLYAGAWREMSLPFVGGGRVPRKTPIIIGYRARDAGEEIWINVRKIGSLLYRGAASSDRVALQTHDFYSDALTFSLWTYKVIEF